MSNRVYQDKRKRYVRGRIAPWIMDYTGVDGRRRREITGAPNRDQALEILRLKMTEISRARIAGVTSLEALKPTSFGEFAANEYLPHCKATHRARTVNGERSVLTLLKGSRLWSMSLRSILPGDVQRWFDEEITRPGKGGRALRPATVNRRFAFVSGALSEAVKRGLIERNPAHGISQLPERNGRIRWLTGEEESRLVAVLPEYLRSIVETAVCTGGRFSEIVGLTWADLDFTARLVRFAETKSGKTRFVPMTADLHSTLRGLSPVIGRSGVVPFVFANPETMHHYTNVSDGYRKAVKRAGLVDVNFHTLRHTFCSRLAQAGVSALAIKELAGHSCITTTMRYMHLAPGTHRAAVDALEAWKLAQIGTPVAQGAAKAQIV